MTNRGYMEPDRGQFDRTEEISRGAPGQLSLEPPHRTNVGVERKLAPA